MKRQNNFIAILSLILFVPVVAKLSIKSYGVTKMTKAVSTPLNPFDVPGMMKDRFTFGTPRSEEYKAGFKQAIENCIQKAAGKLVTAQCIANPYFANSPGSVQADAWWSGFDHGREYHKVVVDRFNRDETEDQPA